MDLSLNRILWALVGLGALAGLYGGWKRYESEGLNRSVELTLEYAEVRTLADVTGRPIQQILGQLKMARISSVAITEETIAGLESRGFLRPKAAGGRATMATVDSPDVFERIRHALASKGFAEKADTVTPPRSAAELARPSTTFLCGSASGLPVHTIFADYSTLRAQGIGLDPEALQDVASAGLRPVGRIANWPGVTPQGMEAVLGDLKQQGVSTAIFVGTEVLGFRGQVKTAAEALQRAGINYGQIEFGKQKGDDKLGIALKGEYIRVHSISDAELGPLDENEVIDRFVRAARERNIRLCYIRLPFLAGSDSADAVRLNVELLEKIKSGIARGREMSFGPAHTFRETGTPTWAFGLMGIGVGAGITLLVVNLIPLGATTVVTLLAVLVVITAGMALGLGEFGRKLAALLAALTFPTLACLRRDLLEGDMGRGGEGESAARESDKGQGARQPGNPTPNTQHPTPNYPTTRSQAAARALSGLISASATTALGICFVVGLLATRPFMLKANQFLGIKAAHAIPILLIGAVAIVGLPYLGRPLAEGWATTRARAARFLSEPMHVGQLLLCVVALIGFALVVARTGNEPGVGVSGIELKFRSLLDQLLPVRPRTKEFLIGHPAFVLGLALWMRGHRSWGLPLFVVGVLGQVSILNTFCHIHTPVMLSLIRDLSGLALGAAVGLTLFWAVDRFLPCRDVDCAAEV